MNGTGSGVSVAGEENVIIAAGDCQVTLLPRFGGKIASIRVRGQELLQQPLTPVAERTRTMAFDAADASGWDECLPSVAACEVPTSAGVARIPDHGDLWRVAWTRDKGTPRLRSGQAPGQRDSATDAVALSAECFSLPLQLERRVAVEETAAGWRIRADYRLTNTGEFETPWSWAAHGLFAAEAGDRIVLPGTVRTLRLEGSGGGRLGKNGDTVSWPVARMADGGETDLSVAQPIESGIGDKLFAGPLGAEESWCVLERPSAGVRIRVSFDAAAMPYLGLWICYGGWPERPGAKQMCVAPEPATAPVDSLAEKGPWTRWLAPGQSYEWGLAVEIELM